MLGHVQCILISLTVQLITLSTHIVLAKAVKPERFISLSHLIQLTFISLYRCFAFFQVSVIFTRCYHEMEAMKYEALTIAG